MVYLSYYNQGWLYICILLTETCHGSAVSVLFRFMLCMNMV